MKVLSSKSMVSSVSDNHKYTNKVQVVRMVVFFALTYCAQEEASVLH